MAGIYEAIAEHVAESRASIDDKRFANWMSSIDDGGDRTFAKLDDAIDELVDRYREEVRDDGSRAEMETRHRHRL